MTHENEILSTRIGGLGGSDAKMVYKVGMKGLSALSNTDIKRLAVLKGFLIPQSIPSTPAMNAGHEFEDVCEKVLIPQSIPSTPAMNAGHEFEDVCEKVLIGLKREFIREHKLHKELFKNIKTFAHADFYVPYSNRVIECKFSQKSTAEVLNTYKEQLQWYYMLGASDVHLLHGWGSVAPFGIQDTTIFHIGRDEDIIAVLLHGLSLLDEYIVDFEYSADDERTIDDLLPWDCQAVEVVRNAFAEIKRLEAEAEKYKEQITEMMRENGIRSIKNDAFTITYVPPSHSNSFDKKKLFKEHPELNESDYTKTTAKADFIKITLK